MQARFDKRGRQLPDTGHGCGCKLCAEANAARYERRQSERSTTWSPLRRRLAHLVRAIGSRRPLTA